METTFCKDCETMLGLIENGISSCLPRYEQVNLVFFCKQRVMRVIFGRLKFNQVEVNRVFTEFSLLAIGL